MSRVSISAAILFFWILFLVNIALYYNLVTYWTICILLIGGSVIAFHSWHKRRVPRFCERYLRSYPLRSNITVPETMPKEYLENYVKNLERVLDSEKDIPSATSVSSSELVQPVAASTATDTYGSAKPDTSSTESAGVSTKPFVSSTETTDDSVKPGDSTKQASNGFVKSSATSIETNNFVLVGATSITTEEMALKPDASLIVHSLIEDLLVTVSENMSEVSFSNIKPKPRKYTDSNLIFEQSTSFESQITEINDDNHDSVKTKPKFDQLQNELKEIDKKPLFTSKDSDVSVSNLESSLNNSIPEFPDGSINVIPLEFIYPCLPSIN